MPIPRRPRTAATLVALRSPAVEALCQQTGITRFSERENDGKAAFSGKGSAPAPLALFHGKDQMCDFCADCPPPRIVRVVVAAS